MRGQKRVEDARKRAYDPRIHPLRKKFYVDGWIAGSSPAMTAFACSTLLRHPESHEHDRKARKLRQGWHLAEREEADQKRKPRHQRREHRGAADPEQHHQAREEIWRGPADA